MKPKTIRNLLIAGMACTVVLLIYLVFAKLMPGLWPLVEAGDPDAIEEYLLQEGTIGGLLCIALLQFIQVLSIMLPGAPIQIAGGLVYGTLRGTVVCHLSYVTANAVVFYMARRMGNRMEQWFPSQKSKGNKVLAWINSSDPAFMTALASLMPGIPNGIIPYAAAKTKLTFRQFVLSVYLASFVPILVMCAIGRKLITGNILEAVLLYAFMLAGIFLLYCLRQRVLALQSRLREKHHEKKSSQAGRSK